MKLSEYLKDCGIGGAEFARQINVTRSAVSRYCAGKRFPSTPIRHKIAVATNGKVTANDFDEASAA